MNHNISRRKLLAIGGGSLAALITSGRVAALYDGTPHGAVVKGLTGASTSGSKPSRNKKQLLSLAGTDGWASMPVGSRPLDPYYPDIWAAENTDTYIFGFRDVTGLSPDMVGAQKGLTQLTSPIVEMATDEELWLTLSNVGLVMRPDLTDSHTVHWHGFRNAIPFYDGVPETSVSVPIDRQFTYVFRPDDAGTYMYHCHFEDVEHVTMGMTGIVFVRPAPGGGRPVDPLRNIVKWAYADATTAFDREYSFMLTDLDSRTHFNDAHILESDWTDFRPNFWLLNGRAYPDTLEPGAPFDTSGTASSNPNFGKPERESDGSLRAPQFTRQPDGTYAPGPADSLKNQPISSLIACAPGEKVLLRLANLGMGQESMSLPGIPLTTVGKDARLVPESRRPVSDIVDLGPGESRDVMFTAPAAGTYPFFNRNVHRYPGTDSDSWSGGQRTHVVVKAGMPAQRFTNHWEPTWL